MNKKELSARAADFLRENDIRKPVKIKKHAFVVTDEDGNSANFYVKRQDKRVLYTVEDVQNILEACIEMIREAVQRGESVFLKDFGTLSVHMRAERMLKRPDNGEMCVVPAHYVPKFSFAKAYKMAAKVYELSMNEEAAVNRLHELELQDTELKDNFEDEEELDFPDLDW